MLMGIIARGTAFAFRHYEAVEDNMQNLYNKIFRYSSFITPFFLGVIAGSAFAGTINPAASNFFDAYIFSCPQNGIMCHWQPGYLEMRLYARP